MSTEAQLNTTDFSVSGESEAVFSPYTYTTSEYGISKNSHFQKCLWVVGTVVPPHLGL